MATPSTYDLRAIKHPEGGSEGAIILMGAIKKIAGHWKRAKAFTTKGTKVHERLLLDIFC
jgi:hypothetical protein